MTTFFKIVFIVLFVSVSCSIDAQSSIPKEEKGPAAKRPETKLTEVITAVGDTVTTDEFVKRAVNWAKVVSPKYTKTGAATTGSKIELIASFITKPKELNPRTDYTGTFTMKIVIECKDGRYKYIVSDIKHTSKSGDATAGSIDLIVPECGSMAIDDMMWRKLRGEAMKDANLIVTELKVAMEKPSTIVETEEW